ncbi:MAG: hypothetical protein WAN34_06635 [Acidimicrobiia bacterium]
MSAWLRIVVGALLLAHGLVHLLYLTTQPDDPAFPFRLDHSWVIPEPSRRSFALGLIAGTIAAFALLALAVWGVPGLSAIWPVITILGSALSLVLLVTFWHRWLAIGVIIDIALIVIAAVQPTWTDGIGS